MRAYIAEFVGTFALAFVVATSALGWYPVSTPVIAAVTLGLFVYTIGHISGAHLNPAVTLGLWSIGKIDARQVGGYLIAQFGAGLVALVIASYVMMGTLSFQMQTYVDFASMGAETLGAFFFAFGIAAVVYRKVPEDIQGVVIGGSLFLGITIAVLNGSMGILNPAVALALNAFSIPNLLGPVIGAVAGMWAYKKLH